MHFIATAGRKRRALDVDHAFACKVMSMHLENRWSMIYMRTRWSNVFPSRGIYYGKSHDVATLR